MLWRSCLASPLCQDCHRGRAVCTTLQHPPAGGNLSGTAGRNEMPIALSPRTACSRFGDPIPAMIPDGCVVMLPGSGPAVPGTAAWPCHSTTRLQFTSLGSVHTNKSRESDSETQHEGRSLHRSSLGSIGSLGSAAAQQERLRRGRTAAGGGQRRKQSAMWGAAW